MALPLKKYDAFIMNMHVIYWNWISLFEKTATSALHFYDARISCFHVFSHVFTRRQNIEKLFQLDDELQTQLGHSLSVHWFSLRNKMLSLETVQKNYDRLSLWRSTVLTNFKSLILYPLSLIMRNCAYISMPFP